MTDVDQSILDGILAGEQRALARAITYIEDKTPGYRALLSELYAQTDGATVIGITGSPGAGKSTLVDKLTAAYRDREETVGVIAIDPSSPFSGGAVLGDRIRMASSVGDQDVFVRSMSARGALGGLSAATGDAVVAMDAFGMDTILLETVGAGQNEIDVMQIADTVAVLVQPGSGDDIQTLKAGLFEIADVFVVNKADRPGADRTVRELREMIDLGRDGGSTRHGGIHHSTEHGPIPDHHEETASDESSETAADTSSAESSESADATQPTESPDRSGRGPEDWEPPIVETVATDGTGLEDLLDALDDHRSFLESLDDDVTIRQKRVAEIRRILRSDLEEVVERQLDRRGGIETHVTAIERGETDPYSVVEELLSSIDAGLTDPETVDGTDHTD